MNINQWVGCGRLTKDAEAGTTKKEQLWLSLEWL